MPNVPSAAGLADLERRKTLIAAEAESICTRARQAGREQLTRDEATRFEAAKRDLEVINARLAEYREDLQRSHVPERFRSGEVRAVNTAGQLAPLRFSDEELRAAHAKVSRGESAALDTRAFVSAVSELPPQLYSPPTFPRHEARLLDRLPGYALESPSLEYVQVATVTGAAQVVGEGQLKPELTMPPTKVITTALKLACHAGISWENIADYAAFTQAVRTELLKQIVDLENKQLVYGTGGGTQLDGMLAAPGILTFAAGIAGPNPNNFDDLAGAIATLRTGPALCQPDLLLLHPNTWASIRTQKAAGTGAYFVSPDPSQDQVEQVWGVEVLQSTAFAAGEGVLLDSTLFGRVAVRESMVLRLGFANDDFVRNIVRSVAEERLNLAVERPAAICHITGLPTAAPTVQTTATGAKRGSN